MRNEEKQLLWISTGVMGFAWANSLNAQYIQSLLSDFGTGSVTIGIVLRFKSVFGLLLLPLINMLSDRMGGRKPFLLIGAAGTSGALLAIAFFSHLAAVPLILIFYLFTSLYEGPLKIYVTEHSTDRTRTAAYMAVMGFAGAIALFLAGTWLLSVFPWERGRTIIFALSAVVVLITYLLPVIIAPEKFKGDKRVHRERREQTLSVQNDRRAGERRTRDLRPLMARTRRFCFIHGLSAFATGSFWNFHALRLRELPGITDGFISFIMLMITIASIAGVIIFYRMAGRLGRTVSLAAAICVLAFVHLGLNFSPGREMMIGLALVQGLCLGAVYSLPLSIVNEMIPRGGIVKVHNIFNRYTYLGLLLSGFTVPLAMNALDAGYEITYWFTTSAYAVSAAALFAWRKD